MAGDVNLTPAAPNGAAIYHCAGRSALIALQLTGQSATGFTIQVTGFTTTRSLTSLAVQFTIAPGFSMPTTQFTINVIPIATVWFESTASKTFGSQFTIAVPFTFQGVVPKGQSILSAISSVSVTMSNAVGSSSSVTAALQ